MTDCQRDDIRWQLLLLGTLEEDEAGRMRAHVALCPECRLRWVRATEVLAAVGATLPSQAPPSHVESRLRSQLVNALAATPSDASCQIVGRHDWWKVGAAAACVVASVLGVTTLVLIRQTRAITQSLRAVEAQLRTLETRSTTVWSKPAGPSADPAPAAPASASSTGQQDASAETERLRLAEALAAAERAREEAHADAERLTSEIATVRQQLADLTAATAEGPNPAPPTTPASADPRLGALEAQVTSLTAEVRRLELVAERQTRVAREYAGALDRLVDERAIRVPMRAIDPGAGLATAVASLTADGRILLVARGLPALPPDKCYQLWVIRRDNPSVVSGGVIDVTNGQAIHSLTVSGASQVTGFALTDEPAGGSAASRGRKLLFGAVDR